MGEEQIGAGPGADKISDMHDELVGILGNAHALIEEIVAREYRARMNISIALCVSFALLTIITLVINASTFILIVSLLFTLIMPFMAMAIWWQYNGRKVVPASGWGRGSAIDLLYWRAYLRDNKVSGYQESARDPNILGYMLTMINDMKKMFEFKSNNILIGFFIVVIFSLNLFLNITGPESGTTQDLNIGILTISILIWTSMIAMDVSLFMMFKSKFLGLKQCMDTYVKRVEEFWRTFW